MNKPYDYGELWDSMSASERVCVLSSIDTAVRWNTDNARHAWAWQPRVIHEALCRVDWEFALGKSLASHAR